MDLKYIFFQSILTAVLSQGGYRGSIKPPKIFEEKKVREKDKKRREKGKKKEGEKKERKIRDSYRQPDNIRQRRTSSPDPTNSGSCAPETLSPPPP